MRLAGQQKAGFFPVPPEAVDYLSKFLIVETPAAINTILDPCCGKGAAVKQFADKLGIAEEHIYGIELDTVRGQEAVALMPKAKIVTPADFTSTKISFGGFSIAWVNPPYDDELGGGLREEARFLSKAIDTIARKGVIMLALPQRVLGSNYAIQTTLMTHFEKICVIPYPRDHRKYEEVVVFGQRRKEFVRGQDLAWYREAKRFDGDPSDVAAPRYIVPAVQNEPKNFFKASYTDLELAIALRDSRLKRMFDPPKPKPMPRPGLQLGAGQRALVLAGGFLNCVLDRDREPILIKASPFKEDFLKDRTEEEVTSKNGDSEMKTTTIMSQRICLRVRVLDAQGEIHDVK